MKGRRNGIAVALRSFKPSVVKLRKGTKAYSRKIKHLLREVPR